MRFKIEKKDGVVVVTVCGKQGSTDQQVRFDKYEFDNLITMLNVAQKSVSFVFEIEK